LFVICHTVRTSHREVVDEITAVPIRLNDYNHSGVRCKVDRPDHSLEVGTGQAGVLFDPLNELSNGAIVVVVVPEVSGHSGFGMKRLPQFRGVAVRALDVELNEPAHLVKVFDCCADVFLLVSIPIARGILICVR
jgi:hypothetical protein